MSRIRVITVRRIIRGMQRFVVIARNEVFRLAVVRTVISVTGLQPVFGADLLTTRVPRGATIIAPSSELTAASCGYLILGHSVRVLILDSFAAEPNHLQYAAVGAEWLPMDLTSSTQARLREFLRRETHPLAMSGFRT